MGQRANNGGRNASLDDKKERAAGRVENPGILRDFDDTQEGRGRTLGAFGNELPKEEGQGADASKNKDK